MKRYVPREIEPKWQQNWEDQGLYRATEDPSRPKKYVLEYFPYPSGAAMHVGHVRNYVIGDVIARYNRMQGYNVLHPMGWDAFGLPAENFAIKTGTSPKEVIEKSTKKFKRQLIQMGFGYDWEREINSTDPAYYKWTQWLFLLLFKRGLAYQKESLQWWCSTDKTVLANEQVENGRCWRCGNIVEKKSLTQWFFKITEYADRLDEDLDKVNWSESIKAMQRNWIGHKKGIDISYKVANDDSGEVITTFTTRPDTNFGATFIVIAPEHPFVEKVIRQEVKPKDGQSHWQAVDHYVKKALHKSELERQEEGRMKTGVDTGFYVINPLNNQKMPIWVSDFVLAGFGTGAVVGVPGHDLRDFQFAQQFNIPIKRVVVGPDGDTSEITREEQVQEAAGKMVNSEFLNGLEIHAATEKMKDHMVEAGMGKRVDSYRIRDWLISRQRYWGAPIPIIHCPKDGPVAVPDNQLPVQLPDVESYEPSGDGQSPLAKVEEFVNTVCPKCGSPAQRETDTMDGFACSSWYFLRFADPHNNKTAFDKDKAKFWLPVDDYIGGAEHAVMHLLYARFWTKVMFDEGLIEFDEPFSTLRNHGMILAPDGQKMSKSKGNTIEPDGLVEEGYGADSIRIMELFIGPWNQAANWSVEGMGGAHRFISRVWTLVQEHIAAKEEFSDAEKNDTGDAAVLLKVLNKTIRKVTEDINNLGFNTAIASLMEMVNSLYKIRHDVSLGSEIWNDVLSTYLQLLAPIIPHTTEELWMQLGHDGSIHLTEWPSWEEKFIKENTMTIAVQVNGKVRAEINVASDASKDEVLIVAKSNEKVAKYLQGYDLKKEIYVPRKLVSLVVS